jgi:hypothetical protein
VQLVPLLPMGRDTRELASSFAPYVIVSLRGTSGADLLLVSTIETLLQQ